MERLEEWKDLLVEEERAQSLDNTEDSNGISNNDLLSSYTHPAVDINAK